jgi:hypothetical protein
MDRFYGTVGYVETVETSPGVWTEQVTERNYYGDIIKNTYQSESSGGVNDNLSISNNISIVADLYANEHFRHIRYVEFMGAKWKVSKADVKHPRLILILGGVYNGEQA